MFAVGDRKQSIYSFQGAAPQEFDAVRDHVAAQVTGAGREWAPVELNVSFRSVEAVLDAVDAVFRRPNARRGVAEGAADIVHLAARQKQGGLVEIWPPVAPAPQDDTPSWKPPVERVAGDVPEFRLASYEVLLSDFGVASLAHSSKSLSTQEVAGTIAYMAPEQIEGKPRQASDQYALGVVLYEWLTGRHPFSGSFMEIAT